MGLALLLNAGELALAPERAWLKARDYAALLDAQGLLEAACVEAGRLKQQACDEAEAVRQAAREQGLKEGRAQAAAELAALSLRSARVLHRLEAAIARAVTATLGEMVQDLPADRLYESALRKAAKVVRGEAFLALRVPPSRESAARSALAALLDDGLLPGAVEVIVDASLADHACVMESEAGIVSAGLDVQLHAIGTAVARELARLGTGELDGGRR